VVGTVIDHSSDIEKSASPTYFFHGVYFDPILAATEKKPFWHIWTTFFGIIRLNYLFEHVTRAILKEFWGGSEKDLGPSGARGDRGLRFFFSGPQTFSFLDLKPRKRN